MTLTEEQLEAIRAVSDLPRAIGCTRCHNYIQKNYGSHFIVLRAMIDSSGTVEPTGGFDLEAARAGIAHYRIENHSNVDTESAIKELVDQANLAEECLDEIERLRADLEQSEICIRARMECIDDQAAYIKELESSLDEAEALTKQNAELMNAYLARIAELEDALVEERAGAIRCEFYDHCEIDLPDAMIRARQELQADGKIGPDAKSVNKGNQCQYCKKCGRDMRFEFSIRDEIWNKLPKTWKDRVLCIECFLEELNEVEPDQEIHFDDFNYMCILDPIEDTEWKGDRPKLLHPLFGGTLIDAKNPLAWQITEKRKAAIDRGMRFLAWSNANTNDPETELDLVVLRAMLEEAGL